MRKVAHGARKVTDARSPEVEIRLPRIPGVDVCVWPGIWVDRGLPACSPVGAHGVGGGNARRWRAGAFDPG
ncbi:hypothetical protein [Streptomyces sp. Inha503]|uniref:hypothetical protein n=1 Tax=Streptomyces sp. Inha503 TaxID=3383314 RepID=UPI0039A28C94